VFGMLRLDYCTWGCSIPTSHAKIELPHHGRAAQPVGERRSRQHLAHVPERSSQRPVMAQRIYGAANAICCVDDLTEALGVPGPGGCGECGRWGAPISLVNLAQRLKIALP